MSFFRRMKQWFGADGVETSAEKVEIIGREATWEKKIVEKENPAQPIQLKVISPDAPKSLLEELKAIEPPSKQFDIEKEALIRELRSLAPRPRKEGRGE